MNNKSPSEWSSVVFGLSIFASILFSILWLREKAHKPKEIIKEIEKPVEVVKQIEKPIEVTREVEVPAKLTEEQKQAIDSWNYILNAESISNDNLKGIKNIKLVLNVTDSIKNIVSEERLRNKIELLLRKNGIDIQENSKTWLSLEFRGLWSVDKTTLIFNIEGYLLESGIVSRDRGAFKTTFKTWTSGSYGTVGKLKAEKGILDSAEELSEEFSNLYLKSNEKR